MSKSTFTDWKHCLKRQRLQDVDIENVTLAAHTRPLKH